MGWCAWYVEFHLFSPARKLSLSVSVSVPWGCPFKAHFFFVFFWGGVRQNTGNQDSRSTICQNYKLRGALHPNVCCRSKIFQVPNPLNRQKNIISDPRIKNLPCFRISNVANNMFPTEISNHKAPPDFASAHSMHVMPRWQPIKTSRRPHKRAKQVPANRINVT